MLLDSKLAAIGPANRTPKRKLILRKVKSPGLPGGISFHEERAVNPRWEKRNEALAKLRTWALTMTEGMIQKAEKVLAGHPDDAGVYRTVATLVAQCARRGYAELKERMWKWIGHVNPYFSISDDADEFQATLKSIEQDMAGVVKAWVEELKYPVKVPRDFGLTPRETKEYELMVRKLETLDPGSTEMRRKAADYKLKELEARKQCDGLLAARLGTTEARKLSQERTSHPAPDSFASKSWEQMRRMVEDECGQVSETWLKRDCFRFKKPQSRDELLKTVATKRKKAFIAPANKTSAKNQTG